MPAIRPLLTLLIGLALAPSVAASRPAAQQQEPTEHWVNPGIGAGAPQDLNTFVATADAMFVGRLEAISVAFIDPEQKWLFTTLTFRPTEWIKPSAYPITRETVDVLASGGTYVEVDGRRLGRKPAEIAQKLQTGAEYFVPVVLEKRPGLPWSGTDGLVGLDAIIRLDRADLAPAYVHSLWRDAILRQAPAALPDPGQYSSRRELLLATLRAAVAKNGRPR